MAEVEAPPEPQSVLARWGSVTNFVATVLVIGLSVLLLATAEGGDDNPVPVESDEATTTTSSTLPPLTAASPPEFVGIVLNLIDPTGDAAADQDAPQVDYSIRRHDSRNGEEIEIILDPPPGVRLSSLTSSIESIAYVSGPAGDPDPCSATVRRITTDRLVTLGTGRAVALAPDDEAIAVWDPCTGGEIRVIDLSTGEFWEVAVDRSFVVRHLAYSPDGRSISASVTVNAAGLVETHVFRPGQHRVLGASTLVTSRPTGGVATVLDDGAVLVAGFPAWERHGIAGATTLLETDMTVTGLASGWAAPWIVEVRAVPNSDDYGTDTVVYRVVDREIADLRSLGRTALFEAAWSPKAWVEARAGGEIQPVSPP